MCGSVNARSGREAATAPRIVLSSMSVRVSERAKGQRGGHGTPDRLVVDVREVHHLRRLVAEGAEDAAHHVFPDERPEVADVHPVVDGGTARVEADLSRTDRTKLLERAAHGVVEAKGHDGRFSTTARDFASEGPAPPVLYPRPPCFDRRPRPHCSSSWTTTRTRPKWRRTSLTSSAATSKAPSPAPRPSKRWTPVGPTSSSWTFACPISPGTRSAAGSRPWPRPRARRLSS